MTSRTIEDYRSRYEDAPLHLVRAAWSPVVRLIDGWAKEKLGAGSGYSSEELDAFSRKRRVQFPPTLREWWRLAGRHPFAAPGLLPRKIARLYAPQDPSLVQGRDFLMIAVDDMQTGSGNGIHDDFLFDLDPEVHGINGTIDVNDCPDLPWYKDKYIATGLRVPTLIFTTLLYHLFEPSDLVRDDAVHLKGEGDPLQLAERKRDERVIAALELKHFPNITVVGDIHSDGLDIIHFWLLGWACRTEAAADRVRRLVPTQPRRS